MLRKQHLFYQDFPSWLGLQLQHGSESVSSIGLAISYFIAEQSARVIYKANYI